MQSGKWDCFSPLSKCPKMTEEQSRAQIALLYVDDDKALVRFLEKFLGRRGFKVTHAPNAEFALSAVQAGGIDVVALDHYLPSGTGLNLLTQFSLLENIPPVVYVTGSSEASVAVAALKAGATDFVLKSPGDDFALLLAAALEQAVETERLKRFKAAADKEVHQARERAELLLEEVNHRVANSLALVASLVRMQVNLVHDEVAKEALRETEARIFAVSQVHKRLYTSGNVSVVNLDEYLNGLLEHLSTSMHSEGHGANLHSVLEPLRLKTDASISLGVIVAEWVTNAFKYAYPGSSGDIRVSLKSMTDGKVALTVADDGAGYREHELPKGTGLGTRIVNAMATNLGAELSYLDGHPGTIAQIIFKGLAV